MESKVKRDKEVNFFRGLERTHIGIIRMKYKQMKKLKNAR